MNTSLGFGKKRCNALSLGLVAVLLMGVFPLSCSSDDSSKEESERGGAAGISGEAGQAGEPDEQAGSSGRSGGEDGGTGNLVNIAGLDEQGGDAGQAGEDTCGESTVNAEQRPMSVLVLLDRSRSMLRPLTQDDPMTRWDAMRDALGAAMEPVADRVAFGLKLFPDEDEAETCQILGTEPEVPVELGRAAIAGIDQAIADAEPNGGTPIAQALQVAYDYFVEGPGSELDGDPVVILATDGAPNCNPNNSCDMDSCVTNLENPDFEQNLCAEFPQDCLDGDRSEAQVDSLLQSAAGIRTVVLGIPGSERPAYTAILEELGAAGGLPNPDADVDYFPVTEADGIEGLRATLLDITTELIFSCSLQLQTQPQDTRLLNVYVDGAKVPRSSENGWELDESTQPDSIQLTGDACAKLESEGARSIEVKYGCPTYIE